MNEVVNRSPLRGKATLVTGAARGLGAEIAAALAAAGARVLIGDVRLDLAKSTAARIRESAGEAHAIHHDVASEASWQSAAQAMSDSYGAFDILVNNAGVEKVALFTQTTLAQLQQLHDVNVAGVFLGIKHAALAMRPGGAAGRGGVIVNVSSVAGLIGMPGLGGYCASKAAVRLMTKAAALEFAALDYGIRVNSIHPAIVKTDMGAKVVNGMAAIGLAPDEASADAYVQSLHPSGYGRPQDVAEGVLFLASDASRWSNGSELVLDGGVTAR